VRKGFLPLRSERRPKKGRKRVLESEKAPKIKPIYRPVAPNSWAYTGSNGTTRPTPSVTAKTARKRVLNTFLFIVS
jgi:hypothetical protein